MKILLVDDHALFRAGMRYVLKELDPDIMLFEARECKQAINILGEANELDLVLLDLNMPGLAGFACINQVMLAAGSTPVVVLSADDRVETIEQVVQIGVKGYIQKSDDALALLTSIKQVLSGEKCFPVDLEKNMSTNADDNPASKLTKRQCEILSLIVEGKSNKQIAAELTITEGTTRIHVTTIFRTLGVRSRSEAVYKALDLGVVYKGRETYDE